jgi:hypothetical protein
MRVYKCTWEKRKTPLTGSKFKGGGVDRDVTGPEFQEGDIFDFKEL